MTRKSLITLFTMAVLIVGSAIAVMAQDNGNNPTTYGPGMMHSSGMNFGSGMMQGPIMEMMGRGFGSGMMGDDDESMMLAAAKALGLESDAFYTALHSGKTLADIAKTQGVDVQTVYDAMLSYAEKHMTELVTAGSVTQAQADQHLSWMRENIAKMPMFSGSGFGPCMDDQADFGSGMMGHGHGR